MKSSNESRLPVFPYEGFDTVEEAEQDQNYMKQLYPKTTIVIQSYVEDACDQLEYEGSCMFDEYPDRERLRLISRKIRDKVEQSRMDTRGEEDDNGCCRCDNSYLDSLVDIMLYNEMLNRRCRYRNHQRWY